MHMRSSMHVCVGGGHVPAGAQVYVNGVRARACARAWVRAYVCVRRYVYSRSPDGGANVKRAATGEGEQS